MSRASRDVQADRGSRGPTRCRPPCCHVDDYGLAATPAGPGDHRRVSRRLRLDGARHGGIRRIEAGEGAAGQRRRAEKAALRPRRSGRAHREVEGVSPLAAWRSCPVPRCPNRTRGGKCAPHRRQAEQARGSAASRGYGAGHRRWRALVLARDPVCPCGAPATVADHVVPLRRGGDWSVENGQGRCVSCHNRKARRERE